MSTRGLYGYIDNGKYTANYNHSDSYPSGLGVEFWTACKQNEFSGYAITKESIGFIKDSLFCEWGFFYDKDNRVFEIWKGFQKESDETNPFGQNKDEQGYYPCKRLFRGHIDSLSADVFEDSDKLGQFLLSVNRDNKISSILRN